MSTKEKLISLLLTVLISIIALIPIFVSNIEAKEIVNKLYKVYLDGEVIGIIKSRDALNDYINLEQKELKEKYGVDTVYLPDGLFVEEYIGYSKNILTERDVYNKIKDIKPFTIKGDVITIKNEDKVLKINVLDEEFYKVAVENIIKTFVNDKEYTNFFNGVTPERGNLGSVLEDLYIKEEAEDKITIKRDVFIPSDEDIYISEEQLTQYLLFGTLEEQKAYVVKQGDTIEDVSFNNKLGTREFLMINREFTNSNNILYPGQKVNVGLISPIITVVTEEEVIEEVVVNYQTEIKYDSSIPYGSSKITQEGQNGLQRITKKMQYENGQPLTNAIITNTDILTPTINKIEVRGVRGSVDDPINIAETGNWFWPTNVPYCITSWYEWRFLNGRRDFHDAIDISCTGHGSPIYASNNGNVFEIGSPSNYNGGRGGFVVINHNNGYFTVYYHLSRVLVNVGQSVNRGDRIGLMGNTGYSFGTHLHFGIYKGEPKSTNHFNPMTLFR